MKKVLIFGSSGMAGHMVTRYLTSLKKYIIINASLDRLNEDTILINVENKDSLEKILIDNKPDIVINCIGLLIKVSEDKPDLAIYLNSFFPHYLARMGREIGFRTIHMSTDCVFSGKKGSYSENDKKDGEDHYALTKSLGEIINSRDLTFRTSIIGPDLNEKGTGLFQWFMNQTETIKGFTNVFWTGVTTLELAKAMDKAIKQNLSSLYHLVPKEKISKYDLLCLINKIWNRNIEIISDSNYLSDKSLINNRKDFNYQVPNYPTMLKEMYEWMKDLDYLY